MTRAQGFPDSAGPPELKEAAKAALSLMGQGQLALTKVAILVDDDVPADDWDAVLDAFRRNWSAVDDALLIPGVPQDTLDFTSFTMNLGSKLVLDCTRGAGGIAGDAPPAPGPGDAGLSELPGGADAPFDEPGRTHDAIADWRVLADTLLVVRVRDRDGRTGRKVAEELAASPRLGRIKWVAVVSDDVSLDDRTMLIWGIFTRFDAARDVVFTSSRLDGAWPRYAGRMAIDATWKPGYPDPIEPDPAAVRKVDERWGSYGIRRPRSP
ncbi:MAG: UbiD family decarboxylase [Gemmatimonadetes bacterium]|nr:UbiD family decarboxylase [Gemmatimonadota bacterium]